MEQTLTADLVKPDYDKVKEIWSKLLSDYYNTDGTLHHECVVDVPCPHCQSTTFHSPFVLNGFRHVTCSYCKVVYVTPRLHESYLERLYNDEYYSEMYTQSMIPAFETRKKLIGQSKAEQIIKHGHIQSGRILDIGCGIGEVLDIFKDNGWDCQAIEVNPTAIQWLKNRNIEVYPDSFFSYPIDEKFDVIMAWGVIEHVTQPALFLDKVVQNLRPGGIFVSEVPCGQSLLIDYCRNSHIDPKRIIMGEQHIILYSIEAYEELHTKHGLTKLHVQTNGLDVETICKAEKQNMNQTTIQAMQSCIDSYQKGDLIRGFWKKV